MLTMKVIPGISTVRYVRLGSMMVTETEAMAMARGATTKQVEAIVPRGNIQAREHVVAALAQRASTQQHNIT